MSASISTITPPRRCGPRRWRRDGRGPGRRRQSVVGPCRRPRGAGAWSRRRGRRWPPWSARRPTTVIFTSGGTEANALAIESAVAAGCERLIVGATEHAGVLETAKALGRAGRGLAGRRATASPTWTGWRAAAGPDRRPAPFVALMLANNETGVIQPVAEAAAMVRAADGWLHVDAIQAAGKIAVDMPRAGRRHPGPLGAQARRPAGRRRAGRRRRARRGRARLHGGGQERGLRAGHRERAGHRRLRRRGRWRRARPARRPGAGRLARRRRGAARRPAARVVIGRGRAAPAQHPVLRRARLRRRTCR